MKQRPILFSTEMVKAILEGRKTQTRRVIKPQPDSETHTGIIRATVLDGSNRDVWVLERRNGDGFHADSIYCPYGKPGDVLWVRETFCFTGSLEYVDEKTGLPFIYKADIDNMKLAEETMDEFGFVWRPSIHMPKDACRLFLRITNVRAERLQDISEQDAVAEGIKPMQSFDSGAGVSGRQLYENYLPHGYTEVLPKDSFQSLWASINGEESYNENPWVWVIEFERVEGGLK